MKSGTFFTLAAIVPSFLISIVLMELIQDIEIWWAVSLAFGLTVHGIVSIFRFMKISKPFRVAKFILVLCLIALGVAMSVLMVIGKEGYGMSALRAMVPLFVSFLTIPHFLVVIYFIGNSENSY